jgi:hypothetical protein
MTEVRRYEIDGKTYLQRSLVLGQIRQLMTVLEGLTIPPDVTVPALIDLLGAKLPEALAVVLTEEGKSPRDKNLAALAAELEFSLPIETACEVVEDFFACNPVAALLDRLTGTMGAIGGLLGSGSTRRSSSSVTAISPSGTASSGDSPRPSASPTSSTAGESSSSAKP